MATMVTINNGTYRGQHIAGETFEVIKPLQSGARSDFITVRPTDTIGQGRDKIRINTTAENIVMHGEADGVQPAAAKVETDEEIMERIGERFAILEEMTAACMTGDVRGMIVVGPPGVGKSYGVLKTLERGDLFDRIRDVRRKFEVVKGAMTPIGLYVTLFNHSDRDQVLVFDDCDSVLNDELALNLLKAALDSGKRRKLYWNSESHYLDREGIPNSFEFKGSVIFITNVDFDHVKSKKLRDHLGALMSRCHYVDTAMKTTRDRILRIKQIHQDGELFKDYNFENGEGDEIVEFMEENAPRLREISLRMAVKIADLIKVSPSRWRRLAETTCMLGCR